MPIGDTIQPAVPTGVGGNGVNRKLLYSRLSQHPLTDYTRAQVQAAGRSPNYSSCIALS